MADAGKLKQENTRLLRRALRGGERFGKNELARLTGLSFPTVSRIVDELVRTGEVRELGAGTSTGGRCAMQVALDPAFRLFLCLRLETDTLHWFVSDLDGRRIEEQETACKGDTLQAISTLLTCVRARYPRLGAAAFGLSGTLKSGTVTETFGRTELRGVSLAAFLQEKLGLPAVVQRDMHAVALGHVARSKKKPRAVACIYLGSTGIGSSLALDGRVWSGANEFAGELHYLPIKNNLEYAKTHFAGVDMVAYYLQVIRAYAALVNPDRVVLYRDALLEGKLERIRSACEKTLPPQAVPELILSGDFYSDYEQGLFELAAGLTEEEL